MQFNLSNLFSRTDNYEKPEAALAMHTAMVEEIKSIRKCAECYANAYHHSDSWFAMACAEPHLIIWAKMKGFKYWPAKFMSVDGQSVNVRFFGDHLYADVPATNCFLYAKTNPKRIRGPSSQYTAALTVSISFWTFIRLKHFSHKLSI